MRYRPLAGTGLTVSGIGFGAWGIGGWTPGELSYGTTDDAVSLAALDRALELGVTFIDTAPLYGLGRSEELIGQAIRGRRDRVVVATKAGYRDYSTPADYSPAGIVQSLERSLRRLGTDHVDLLQLHSPSIDLLRGNGPIIDCLAGLVQKGLIRGWGLSVNSPAEGAAAIREFRCPVVQANFNMLDVRAIECGLFELARSAGSAVIARTPLNFGFLVEDFADDTVFPPEDHRSRWNGGPVARWARMARAIAAATGGGDAAARVRTALRFCLSFDAVAAVIPGILTPRQAEENAAAGDLDPLPPEIVDTIVAMSRDAGTAPAARTKPEP